MPEVKDLFDLIRKSHNILLLIDNLTSKKEASLFSLVVNLITSENKPYEAVSPNKISSEISKYLKTKNIGIEKDLKPSEYVVTIDYGNSQVDKIVYDTDKENNKLIFKILPAKGGFSFDKVEFKEGGCKFDSVICIGIEDPKKLGDFYDRNEYLFKESSYFKFKNFKEISSVLARAGNQLPQEIFDDLMSASLEEVGLLEGYPEEENLQDLLNLSLNGGNISNAINKKYYSKPSNFIQLSKIIFENLVIQKENKIIYSVVTNAQLKEIAIEKEGITNLGRIPFNISKDFDLAFVIFETDVNELQVVVESNQIEKYSAQTIAGIFNGKGDKGHAVCTLDIALDEIDKRFLVVLKDLYNIDISLTNKGLGVDNYTKKLTKGRKYSKNKGLIK